MNLWRARGPSQIQWSRVAIAVGLIASVSLVCTGANQSYRIFGLVLASVNALAFWLGRKRH